MLNGTILWITFGVRNSEVHKRKSNVWFSPHPVNQEKENYDLSYEDILLVEYETWQMYFDSSSNHKVYGVDNLKVSP